MRKKMQLTQREIGKFESCLQHDEREPATIDAYLRSLRKFAEWADGRAVTKHPGQQGEIYHGGGSPFRGGGDHAEGAGPHHSAAKPPVPQAVKIRQKTQNRLGRDFYHPKRYGNEPETDLGRNESTVQSSRRGAGESISP